mmetsp:Transcript_80752/g.179427  ORF Transcript_80752/g.179427 Transcript_80752/m.179427 type:complete len:216 (+) Transcript_80752:1037-1684(+)
MVYRFSQRDKAHVAHVVVIGRRLLSVHRVVCGTEGRISHAHCLQVLTELPNGDLHRLGELFRVADELFGGPAADTGDSITRQGKQCLHFLASTDQQLTEAACQAQDLLQGVPEFTHGFVVQVLELSQSDRDSLRKGAGVYDFREEGLASRHLHPRQSPEVGDAPCPALPLKVLPLKLTCLPDRFCKGPLDSQRALGTHYKLDLLPHHVQRFSLAT